MTPEGLPSKPIRLGSYICIGSALFAFGLTSISYAAADKAEYELRERCGKRAEQVWRTEFPNDGITNHPDGSQTTTNYKNHYSATLNKCFYLQTGMTIKKGNTAIATERLYDINENNEYGMLVSDIESPSFVKKVFVCFVKDKKCSSENEWRELLKPFMEDAD
ncbi:MAG: hypothetical protein ACR2K5_12025 [Pseudolabrys sp.]